MLPRKLWISLGVAVSVATRIWIIVAVLVSVLMLGILMLKKSSQKDSDECLTGLHDCSANATCTNTVENYTCTCNEGYSGDGISCFAICYETCENGTTCMSPDVCKCPDEYEGDQCKTLRCPGTDDWKPFGSYLYCFADNAEVSWLQAEIECDKMGADLASIHSQEEQDFIGNNTEHNGEGNAWWGFWIGLNARNIEGAFEWTDGSPVNYTYWLPNQPSSAKQDCAIVVQQQGDKWDDTFCDSSSKFVPYVYKKLLQ